MANYNVVMVCAEGMSSSLLVNKTRQAAESTGHALTIRAISAGEIAVYDFGAKPVDLVLIAPQVRYKKKSVSEMAAPYGIAVQDIEPTTFGMMDGEKLFEQIKQAVQKEK
jgi:PTS system cellobiose-specific IIB component